MLNLEQIKRELKKYNFVYEENVLPVHANGHYFLYGFYEKGIAIFALRPDSFYMGRCVVSQGEKEFDF